MKIEIEIDQAELKQLVLDAIEKKLGDVPLDKTKVQIVTKSTQNYKAEWETAAFKATYSVSTSAL